MVLQSLVGVSRAAEAKLFCCRTSSRGRDAFPVVRFSPNGGAENLITKNQLPIVYFWPNFDPLRARFLNVA
jgi:hypothetical protein